MKTLLLVAGLVLSFIFAPTTVFAASAAPWQINNLTDTFISPSKIGGLIKGLFVLASTTIGDGTQTGGLTIFGGATTTGNAYFAGNVGIGTTTPTRKLSVAGDGLFTGTLYFADTSSSYIRWTAATSKLEMFGGSTGFEINNAVGNVKVYRHGTSASNLFNVTSTGLVGASGIQSALVVDPTMTQTGTAGYNGLLVNITESTTGSGRKMLFSAQTAGVDKFNITSAGNVGIASTSPYGLFSVNPNGIGSAPAFVVGSSTATLMTLSNIGDLTVARGISNQGGFNISASGNFRTANYFQGINAQNRMYLDDTFLGSATAGTVKFSNSAITDFQMMQFGGSSALYPGFRVNTATQAISVTNANGSLGGRFGVGTTTPFAKLSVHGNDGETLTTLFAIASSTATATTTLFAVTNIGNVGIGTTSPQGVLSVQGPSSGSATKGTCFRAKDVGSNTFTYWWYKAGVQAIQTADCGGAGTTTITYD